MESQDQPSRALAAPLSTILLLVVAAGGYVLFDRPLSSSRPSSRQTVAHPSVSSEDVTARLWQDPFGPAMAHRSKLSAGKHTRLHRIGEISWAVDREFHTHPSGDPAPSRENLLFTRRVARAGQVVGVELVDHLVVGTGGAWVSLRERGGWWGATACRSGGSPSAPSCAASTAGASPR